MLISGSRTSRTCCRRGVATHFSSLGSLFLFLFFAIAVAAFINYTAVRSSGATAMRRRNNADMARTIIHAR